MEGFSGIEVEFIKEAKMARFLFPISMEALINEVYELAGQYEEAAENLHVLDWKAVNLARTERIVVRQKLDEAGEKLLALAEAQLRMGVV